MALGSILKEARERKGLTSQQVAETTRMMVQIVEDLELEDFRRIAAPLYGRGFIKLYAECVGIDPDPLVAEFIEIFTGKRPPQIQRRAVSVAPPVSARLQPDARKPETASLSAPITSGPGFQPPAQGNAPSPGERIEQKSEPAPEVMPLDEPAEEPASDLFTLAQNKRPTAPQRQSRGVREPAALPPRVLPFSGGSPTAEQPDDLPEETAPPPPKRSGEAAWCPSRVVVREVARIWSGMPRLPSEWLTPRRMMLAVAVVAGVAILLLGVRFLAWLTERSASQPVVSVRVLPPPPPYFE